MNKVPEIDKSIGLLAYGDEEASNTDFRIKINRGDFIVIEELYLDEARPYRRYGEAPVATLINVVKPWMMDTFRLIRELSRSLNIPRRRVRPMGLKDSASISVQHMLIRGIVTEADLVKIEDFEPELIGYIPIKRVDKISYRNRFHVTVHKNGEYVRYLRDVSPLFTRDVAIPNFYGYQRFGHLRYINHEIGERIVKARYRDAILAFLTYTTRYEDEEVRKWRNELRETLNYRSALKTCPRTLNYERGMLKSLVRHEGDFRRALLSLPKRLLKLLIQSYQSYIYNIMLSRRLMAGLPISSALEGDYIITENRVRRSDAKVKVSPLIPLVGYGYRASRGPQGEIEVDVINELGIEPKRFYIKDIPELSLKGGFRVAKQEIHHLTLEEFKSSIHIETTLSKGSFCTILLRELFKPIDPVIQGF